MHLTQFFVLLYGQSSDSDEFTSSMTSTDCVNSPRSREPSKVPIKTNKSTIPPNTKSGSSREPSMVPIKTNKPTKPSNTKSHWSRVPAKLPSQTDKPINNNNTDLNTELVPVDDISVAEMLTNIPLVDHIDKVFSKLTLLISAFDTKEFGDELISCQNIHRYVRDEIKKYMTKSVYVTFLESLDTTIKNHATKYKGKKRRAMMHFLEIVYHTITLFMPKDYLGEY